MISKHVPYLLLFVAGYLCMTGGVTADDAKAPKVTAAEAAAKAAAKTAEEEAKAAAKVAAAAAEAAAKAAAKAATTAAAAEAAKAEAAKAEAAAKAAKVPEAQVKKASEQIKKAIEAHQSLDDSLIAAWQAAKALPASKKAHDEALQAVIEATAAANKVREQLKSAITEEEQAKLEKDLAAPQLKYGLTRNLLDIADNSYQRSVSDLKKALALAKKSHQTAIDQASKMEALLETIAQEKSDAKKGDQKPPAVLPTKQAEPKPASAAEQLPPPTAADPTAGRPLPPAATDPTASTPLPPAATDPTASRPLPPNPRVREMIPPSTHLWHVDAFRKLPLVQEVKAAQELGEFDETSTATAVGESSTPEFVCDYRFDRPAHFPLPEFGLGGETFDDSGLVIYEGMRLAVRPDGRYQVRFVVGTPAVPVEMKLQFILEDQATLQRYTLTLPRVAIPPKKKPTYASQRRDIDPVYQDVQTVHHEGYLPFLAQQSQAFRIVRRTGTARFGFGVHVP